MNEKINKLILCFIPTNSCNLSCEYCLVSQTNEWKRNDIKFKFPIEHIIRGLSKKRLGGTCYINLTAQGETLLFKDIVQLTRGLLEEGHYVEIITNGTVSVRIDEILSFPEEILRHLFFKISYHYNQMKNEKMKENYWKNVKKIKKSPCSFTLEIMPHDEIVEDIDKICQFCTDNAGAVCHATVGRDDRKNSKNLLTKMPRDKYVYTWSKLHSTMFKLKMELFGVKRKEFCYAGDWSLLIDLASGEASQCYGRINTQNIFENLSKPIKFKAVGHSCMQAFCFNGHAHIAWGVIPKLKAPTYYEVRNRQCVDGSSWVKADCESFFNQKLSDNNMEYSGLHKVLHIIGNPCFLFVSLFHDIPGVKRKIVKFYKIIKEKF